MSKKVTKRLDTKDMSNPGIAKRTRNLLPAGTIPAHILEIVKEIGNQQEMAEKYAPIILAALVDNAINCKNDAVRASCQMYLADRIYGKAIQPLLVNGSIEVTSGVIILSKPEKVEDTFDTDDHGNIISGGVIDVKSE